MQLKKMIITNYRQFNNAEINFDKELTILAGANNSGKTAIIELFSRVFKDKKFDKNDVSVSSYEEMQKNFINTVNSAFKKSKTDTEFRENLKRAYSDDNPTKLVAIKIGIEVQYNKDESFAMFSDYLMELDDDCTSFYFLYNYELDISKLIKDFNLKSTSLYEKAIKIINEKGINKSAYDELVKDYNDELLGIFDSCFTTNVYFTDRYFKNEISVGIKEFQSLFKYDYLQATRVLNDEKTDNYFSISKELLNHFKQSNDWTEFKTNIIHDIKKGLEVQQLNEKIKEHSLIKAKRTLEDIEKYFDYNKGEFSLQTDISDDLLLKFLSSSLQTFYEYKSGVKLKEFSQGLGISNLIYICLKVEAFTKQYQKDVVNIFVIEEPEAHMHPQMERMLIRFVRDILKDENNNNVQGIITTHSNEIIKCSELKNIRILRINGMLTSSVYDMNKFKEKLDTNEERQFFDFLFSINYSDLIFANKIIMYEGDTEKLYIEKLLLEKEFDKLSNQYISFVQVGGAYTHWYRKLIYFLEIKTLIITDIDYDAKLTEKSQIKQNRGITNAGLKQYYKDYITLDILNKEVLPYCENRCRQKKENCIYQYSELDRICKIQSDLRRKPCDKIKRPNYSSISNAPNVEDINKWMKNDNHPLIKVVTQGENDCYTRTLEEAMICSLLGISIETGYEKNWWKTQIADNSLQLGIPNKRTKITVRDIIVCNKNNKTNFMYSVILKELQSNALPNYIKEGLEWLMK